MHLDSKNISIYAENVNIRIDSYFRAHVDINAQAKA